ncbi:MAG: bifunctional folylpolyglutamate synthase/dihydrofolate synthase [Chloroflexia bacterium]|nr:bifunctional folylpolyglutamate synthase/dihydrofolate synthase [Chloroflexia bacterium]
MADELQRYRALERELAGLIGPRRFEPAVNLRLERIRHLLRLLDHPERDLNAIHVGGTSGKGSTAAMAAAMLTAAGQRTGLYLSPHLQVLNECYQIDGRMAATGQLAALFARLRPAIEQVGRENPLGRPSYFEAQTALAFCLFREEGVEAAVVEVGLGGAGDATNTLPARVAVLTSVGLDHTDILGGTLEEIARVKAGIIKPGQVVVSGIEQDAPRQIVERRCAEQGATFRQLGQDFGVELQGETFGVILPGRRYEGLRPALQGDFQRRNAACAVAAAQALEPDLPQPAAREGLARAWLPGRLEVVQERPTVILDGAHNPTKLRAAARSLAQLYPVRRRWVVLALKSDKDARGVLDLVVRDAEQLILTTFSTALWEATPPEALAEIAHTLAPDLDVHIVPDPLRAVEQALAAAGPKDLVWVTGSLYLVGNVRQVWYPLEDIVRYLGDRKGG